MLKLVILIIYFAVLIGIGLYCRKHATDVNGFVLGGRSVGPWLTAFAYGTSYFSAVVFVGYAGNLGWYRQRNYRFTSCMGHTWQKNKNYESAP